MKNRTYARKLTKEELIKAGITLITEDGLVFKGETQMIPTVAAGQNYLVLNIYELDEEGNKIKVPMTRTFKGCTKAVDTYIYKGRVVGLHRAMWAWFHDEVPEGYVVDHINNKHDTIEDYHLSNLQLLTPAENLEKEKGVSTKEIPCKLDRPLSFYENKLNNYLEQYDEAKKTHNADLCHKLRINISTQKAKTRYWLSHKEEAEALAATKQAELMKVVKKHSKRKDVLLLRSYSKVFKSRGNLIKWHEICSFIKNYDSYDSELINKFIDCIKKEADRTYEK